MNGLIPSTLTTTTTTTAVHVPGVKGGVVPPVVGGGGKGVPVKRFTNAYMLVYVRASRVGEMLAPISTEEVPENIR